MRVSVRSTPEAPAAGVSEAPLALPEPGPAPVLCARRTASSRSSRRWSARSTGPPSRGRRRSSRSATSLRPGQTLCILEAMKLMNEVKSELEAVVRAIHVDNAQPVEFGQVLFDLEPLAGRRRRASACSSASS